VTKQNVPRLHFDVSSGLKRVLGRELITDDDVAIFEMVKNSFDAGANNVQIYFGDGKVIVVDDGSGMSYQDVKEKWLFVAYSEKRTVPADFRSVVAGRGHFAGSKGIGRFSSDRLGELLTLQTRSGFEKPLLVHRLSVDWSRFESDARQHFDKVPVEYSESTAFDLPDSLKKFTHRLKHGTAITLTKLRKVWDREAILELKNSLAKLINPFGAEADSFHIFITAPDEIAQDNDIRQRAGLQGLSALPRDIVNGRVGNFIFSELQHKTTFITVSITGDGLHTVLTDRGEMIYKIREPNPYPSLARSGFRCEMYYLNHSAKLTFARRVGLPSVQFGSVFVFRNDFRVFPIGEADDDWFGFNRRKQQGYSRFLGTREIIGRVDVIGSDEDFQEASSRNQGLIETPAVRDLRKAVLDHSLKRLEKYVVPVSWADKADADADDLTRLLTDPGRARVAEAVASLVDNDDIELIAYSRRIIGLLNERSAEFEASLESVRSIATKTGDKVLLANVAKAEKRFEQLKRSEAEAHEVAARAQAAAYTATARATAAEAEAATVRTEAEAERRRAYFLEAAVNLDAVTILNLHHQVTIYAVAVAQQIENLLSETATKKSIPREFMLQAIEQIAFLNRKILSVTQFAAKAKFQLDSEMIDTDLAAFLTEYIEEIAQVSGSARIQVDVRNRHPGIKLRFKPIDASIIVENLISNARRAKASRISFELTPLDKAGLVVRVTDNGRGISPAVGRDRIFDMGYTTTGGSGLGLYHVRQVLGEMGGSIEVEDPKAGTGAAFLIKIAPRRHGK
jgi:signal transduction histidine kinase